MVITCIILKKYIYLSLIKKKIDIAPLQAFVIRITVLDGNFITDYRVSK